MPILDTCKFEEDQIKNEGTIVSTPSFSALKAGNPEVNGRMWPELELIRVIRAVLVTCKFDDDSIKNEGAIVSTTFSPSKVYGKKNSALKGK